MNEMVMGKVTQFYVPAISLRQEPDEGKEDDGDGNRDDVVADEGEGYSE